MSSPIADLKSSKTVKKFKPIQYKEQRASAWCGNSIVDEYWKQKDKEYREKQSS